MQEKTFDLIVYGATGFTGQLICRYLQEQYNNGREFSWAMAGRTPEKLESVRAAIGAFGIHILTADANDPQSLEDLASLTKSSSPPSGPISYPAQIC